MFWICSILLIFNIFPLRSPFVLSSCHVERGYAYDSLWNDTALLKCNDQRTENICIVGGGLSGIHMGWLLKRRGFLNTIVFEKSSQIGGMIKTSYQSDGVPRELSAAFICPDYDETIALLNRYKLTQLPIDIDMISYRQSRSASNMPDVVLTPEDWYYSAITTITGSTDMDYNFNLVVDALEKYTILHKEMFGSYITRLPPKPTSYPQIQELKGSFLEYLQRHDLVVLIPIMFQIFTVKGVSGPLSSVNAYYGLAWCSPPMLSSYLVRTLKQHGPSLSAVEEGLSTLLDFMVVDVELNVLLNQEVVFVDRSGCNLPPSDIAPIQVTTQNPSGEKLIFGCDLLILSGPVPKMVTSSYTPTLEPEIAIVDTSPAEQWLFESKEPMQYLQSLVSLPPTQYDPSFKALDIWPREYFTTASGEVLNRFDISNASFGTSSGIGTIQSFSYLSSRLNPLYETMLAKQRQWIQYYSGNSTQMATILDQLYVNTYMYHYKEQDILLGKPWDLNKYQGLPETRTLYIGGSVSMESIEDVIDYNLQLVRMKFDEEDIFDSFIEHI